MRDASAEIVLGAAEGTEVRRDVEFAPGGRGGRWRPDLQGDGRYDLGVPDGGEGAPLGVEGEDGRLEAGASDDVVRASVGSCVGLCEF